MFSSTFFDWAKNYCIPELKEYPKKKNISFKFKILVDINENVVFEFLPPNTTSIIQPMVQGAISNFECYYLRRTFAQLLKDNKNQNSIKDF